MAARVSVDLVTMRDTEAAMRSGLESKEHLVSVTSKTVFNLLKVNELGQAGGSLHERWDVIEGRARQQFECVSGLADRLRRFADRIEEVGSQLETTGESPAQPVTEAPDVGEPPAGNELPASSFKPLPSGPTTAPNVMSNLAGCTNYVASRVNLDDWGRWPNAEGWNDVAQAAGYPVGSTPATGAIMVFEPGVMGADSSAGHVAYVEQVVQEGDVYHVRISEANVAYGANGNVLWGTHTTPTQRELTFRIGSDGTLYDDQGNSVSGVSFIYGR